MGRDGADSDWQREHGMASWEEGRYMLDNSYTPPQKAPRKIELHITEEELIEDLARDLFVDAFSSIEHYRTPNGYEGDEFSDGLGLDNKSELRDNCYLEFRSYKHEETEVSLPVLSRVLKRTGLPIKDRNADNWFVWNNKSKRFEAAYQPFYWRERKRGAKTFGIIRAPANIEGLLQDSAANDRLLARTLITTNHGQKPLLVHHRDINALILKEPVPFTLPGLIDEEDLDQYVLAYYNNAGEIRAIPLPDALYHNRHIATRSGTYQQVHDGLRNLYRYPNLHRNAFTMALEGGEPALTYFRLKPAGTIYEPAIEQIPAKDRTRYPADEILITTGGHPLEVTLDDGLCPASLTTTPGLYQFARQTIEQYAYLVGPLDVQPG
ncbi:MAG: hypothetical protein EP323_04110 [Gammaproteobacteria bacterium]|nr:MAG: hypothetical protein EP323_04110 [Gammaproteobacteria bacterium]